MFVTANRLECRQKRPVGTTTVIYYILFTAKADVIHTYSTLHFFFFFFFDHSSGRVCFMWAEDLEL